MRHVAPEAAPLHRAARAFRPRQNVTGRSRPVPDLRRHPTQRTFMKNVQVIDGAVNCVYDIFAATDQEFALIFPDGHDIAFIDEVYARGVDEAALNSAFEALWKRRVVKAQAMGIHGQLFYELDQKKAFYPSRRDGEAENPGGHRLR
jgi:hypothetical protein